MLLLANLRFETNPLSPQRMLFVVVALAAGLLTFIPMQQRMGLPHLAFEGTGGTLLLLYTLAFVPPPTSPLSSLPDLPVYCLLIAAVFWSSSAAIMPFVYTLRQRFVKQRSRRLDVREAQRQAHEVGTLAACVVALAGLYVLTWISFLLVVLILIAAELLFLSWRKDPKR